MVKPLSCEQSLPTFLNPRYSRQQRRPSPSVSILFAQRFSSSCRLLRAASKECHNPGPEHLQCDEKPKKSRDNALDDDAASTGIKISKKQFGHVSGWLRFNYGSASKGPDCRSKSLGRNHVGGSQPAPLLCSNTVTTTYDKTEGNSLRGMRRTLGSHP